MTRALAAALAAALLAAAPARAADLTVWGLQAFNQAADDYIGEQVTAFGKAAGIDAHYVVVPANVLNDRLAAAFEGGAPPDAFMQVSQRAQFYISRGLTLPLDDVLADLHRVPGGIFDGLVAPGRWQGTVQALPLEVDVVPMFVRTDLLAEVGLKVPDTWDELRAAAKAIQGKHPTISGFGMPISTANDAEGNMRSVIWSFGGKLMAEDGRTVTFDSPETRAAYQFVADMVTKDRTIPRAALTWDDSGNNVAYQTGRAAFVINPPSIYYWLKDNDPTLLAATDLAAIPKGPGPNGRRGTSAGSWVWLVSKASKHPDQAKAWLRWFFDADRYRGIIDKVGGRWVPVYPALLESMPLFKDNPKFAAFRTMAETGIVDGYAGPPNALAGNIWDANLVTKVLQKIVVDGMPVGDAVAWGQKEMEALAAKG